MCLRKEVYTPCLLRGRFESTLGGYGNFLYERMQLKYFSGTHVKFHTGMRNFIAPGVNLLLLASATCPIVAYFTFIRGTKIRRN